MFRLAHTLRGVRLVGVIASLAVMSTLMPAWTAPPTAGNTTIATLEETQNGFHQVNEKVAPAVVTITTTAQVTQPSADDSLGQFFFGMPRTPAPQVRNVSGSGVIVRPEGIILTNSHVVQDATKVTVQLSDSDKQLPAEVVQSDSKTDLAIVRITEKGVYPTALMGDAKNVQVGDWAIAFGSPYRLRTTMTVGVISATGRRLGGDTGDFNYYDLLQTDTAINHGNSGGPLVNIRGEVIGINFMIFSPGEDSGSIGIGFAIPINEFTKNVIKTLEAGKAVERGRIGIKIDDLSDAMREEFGVKEGGVIVQSVVPGQAGDKAGIHDEDIITEFDGVKITDPAQFINQVQQTPPGKKVNVAIIRNKKTMTLPLTLGSDAPETVANANNGAKPNTNALNETTVGLRVATLTPNLAQRLGITDTSGVVVVAVGQGSPAESTGLQQGDIILQVHNTKVTTEEEFWNALSKEMSASKVGVLLRVRSKDEPRLLTMPQINTEAKK